MAARVALSRLLSSSASPAPRLIRRRALAAGADHHGLQKVNIWEDPLSPSKWKEEHYGDALVQYGEELLVLEKKNLPKRTCSLMA